MYKGFSLFNIILLRSDFLVGLSKFKQLNDICLLDPKKGPKRVKKKEPKRIKKAEDETQTQEHILPPPGRQRKTISKTAKVKKIKEVQPESFVVNLNE